MPFRSFKSFRVIARTPPPPHQGSLEHIRRVSREVTHMSPPLNLRRPSPSFTLLGSGRGQARFNLAAVGSKTQNANSGFLKPMPEMRRRTNAIGIPWPLDANFRLSIAGEPSACSYTFK